MHLDTHVVAWLYSGDTRRFPARVLEMIETESLAVSPMVVLELQFLHEIGRLSEPGQSVVEDLAHRIGLAVASTPFPTVVSFARSIGWTRDPFDRLIAAQARAEDARLLTADESILGNLDLAVWG